jgi:hypothetical protein
MFTELQSASDSGLQFMAQLRSQRAPFAMAWLGTAELQAGMSTVETATILPNHGTYRAVLHRLKLCAASVTLRSLLQITSWVVQRSIFVGTMQYTQA